jgi:hypothetical protein
LRLAIRFNFFFVVAYRPTRLHRFPSSEAMDCSTNGAFGASEEGSIQIAGAQLLYPHPLIARQMRQFLLLRQPWCRYMATYDPDAKAFEKRQYRKAQPDLDPRV